MYQETTLTMPKQFAALTAEEMTYTDGGQAGADIKTTRSMLKKSYCTSIAGNYVNSSTYNPEKLGKTRIAKEIFAHAQLYFNGVSAAAKAALASAFIGNPVGLVAALAVMTKLSKSGKAVNLGGDSWYREVVYNVMWALPIGN